MEDVFAAELFLLLSPALVVGLILVLVTARRDPDAAGRRTAARYVGAIVFVAIFLTLFAAFASVSSLAELAVKDVYDDDVELDDDFEEEFDFEEDFDFDDEELDFDDDQSSLGRSLGRLAAGPRTLDLGSFEDEGRSETDVAVSDAVQAGLVGAAALLVLVFHLRCRRRLQAEAGYEGSAAWAVNRTTIYVVCFVAALVFLVAAGEAAYGVFRVLAPGITSGAPKAFERERGLADIISLGFLAAGAGVIFWAWWREAPDRSALRG